MDVRGGEMTLTETVENHFKTIREECGASRGDMSVGAFLTNEDKFSVFYCFMLGG